MPQHSYTKKKNSKGMQFIIHTYDASEPECGIKTISQFI